MENKILIFGAGGLCKQILNNNNINDNYFIYQDEYQDEPLFDEFFKNYKTSTAIDDSFTHFIVGVSGPKNREKITDFLIQKGLKPINFINSKRGESATIKNNVIILQDVFIEPCVSIDTGSLINVGSKIFHDVKIGRFCEIAPQSCLLGAVQIGDYTFIGAGSIVLPKVKIGKNCVIGAGSVVTKDIPDNQVWLGSPAKFTRCNT